SPSTELPMYLCVENIQEFVNYCKEKLGMTDDALFIPDDLYNYSIKNFSLVLDSLIEFFSLPSIQIKIQEHIKSNKVKHKSNTIQSLSQYNTSANTSFVVDQVKLSQEDF